MRQVILALIRIPQVVSSCETHLIAHTCSIRPRRDLWWWDARAATATPPGLTAMPVTELGVHIAAIDDDTIWLSALSEVRQPGTPSPNCSVKDRYGYGTQHVSTKRVGTPPLGSLEPTSSLSADRTASLKVYTFDSKAGTLDLTDCGLEYFPYSSPGSVPWYARRTGIAEFGGDARPLWDSRRLPRSSSN